MSDTVFMGASGYGPDNAARVPPALAAHWRDAGVISPRAQWRRLAGGRTNGVWKVTDGSDHLVVKLYANNADTPLFRNDPFAEAKALAALAGHGLAPELVDAAETAVGWSLIYRHLAGRPWGVDDDPAPVARALARVHAIPPPSTLFPAMASAEGLVIETLDILDRVGPLGAHAVAVAPPVPGLALGRPRFLHGDPTAANTIVSPEGARFVDWQSPALGDPVLDLAVFLSPGMQVISGNRPLDAVEAAAFLRAYGDGAVSDRYASLAALLHWRIAAHCLWRAARDDEGYADAAEAELALVRTLS